MIYNPTILKNEYKIASSNSAGLNILRLIQMALAFIVIAWLNWGTFTYIMFFAPDPIRWVRWGSVLAWFSLALTSNKKFAKTFCVQCWPLLFFYFYILVISLFVKENLEAYIRGISYLIMIYSIFLYYFDEKYRRFQKFLSVFLLIDCVAVWRKGIFGRRGRSLDSGRKK